MTITKENIKEYLAGYTWCYPSWVDWSPYLAPIPEAIARAWVERSCPGVNMGAGSLRPATKGQRCSACVITIPPEHRWTWLNKLAVVVEGADESYDGRATALYNHDAKYWIIRSK